MSKHQVCPNCHSDFVGPDSNINHNLCRDCDEMIHVDCHKQITQLQAENARLKELVKIKNEFLAAYRMNRNVPEKVWSRFEKLRELDTALKGEPNE